MVLRLKKGARAGRMYDAATCTYTSELTHTVLDEHPTTKKEQKEITKKKEEDRQKSRIPMKHNSLFLLDPHTNRHMLHSIKRDKRPSCEKTDEELKEGGARISITFRWIHTFERISDGMLFGGGSIRKEIQVDEAGRKLSITQYIDKPEGNDTSSINNPSQCQNDGHKMLLGFSKENSDGDTFNWMEVYGSGFDAKEAPTLF